MRARAEEIRAEKAQGRGAKKRENDRTKLEELIAGLPEATAATHIAFTRSSPRRSAARSPHLVRDARLGPRRRGDLLLHAGLEVR